MQQANGTVRMPSSDWLSTLNRFGFGDYANPPKGWPTTGKVLSDRLKRLQPTMAARGVSIEWGRQNKARYIEISRIPMVVPEQRGTAEQTEFQGIA